MDIITMAREMGKAIQQEEVYKKLNTAKELNDNDEALQKLIEKFNVANAAYEYEANKDNPNSQRIDELEEDLEGLYEKIMGNANMIRFEQAKADMDMLMSKVVAILAAAVNGDDPMTVDPDALISEECDGDCDCCGHDCGDPDHHHHG